MFCEKTKQNACLFFIIALLCKRTQFQKEVLFMAYKTINPYTNEVEKEFPNATDEELEAVLAKAHQL